MNKNGKILAILLVVAGISCLGVVKAVNFLEDEKISPLKEKFSAGTDKHFDEYQKYIKIDNKSEMTQEELVQYKQKHEQLMHEQPEMLMADISELASGAMKPGIMADMKYGPGWQKQVNKYKSKQSLLGLVSAVSAFSCAIGLIIFACITTNTVVRSIRKKAAQKITRIKRPDVKSSNSVKITDGNRLSSTQTTSVSDEQSKEEEEDIDTSTQAEKPRETQQGQFQKSRIERAGLTSMQFRETAKNISSKKLGIANMMSNEPVSQSLSELSEQVSAIRQFATQQQDRVRQLQDGYDWNIVKRFCIRIIRCIDNVDSRIENLRSNDIDTQDLEDIRDELVFALESSGVEQFTPPLEHEYKGLEKYAEALHYREPTEDEELAGKIAKVTKPGYQYVVSENEIKIVRCAQVTLYGHKLNSTVGV